MDQLPEEIVTQIGSSLPAKSLIMLANCCHQFQYLMCEPAPWKRAISRDFQVPEKFLPMQRHMKAYKSLARLSKSVQTLVKTMRTCKRCSGSVKHKIKKTLRLVATSFVRDQKSTLFALYVLNSAVSRLLTDASVSVLLRAFIRQKIVRIISRKFSDRPSRLKYLVDVFANLSSLEQISATWMYSYGAGSTLHVLFADVIDHMTTSVKNYSNLKLLSDNLKTCGSVHPTMQKFIRNTLQGLYLLTDD